MTRRDELAVESFQSGANSDALQMVMDAISMPVGILVWNTRGELSFVNDRTQAIAGRQVATGGDVAAVISALDMRVTGSDAAYPATRLVPNPETFSQVVYFDDAQFHQPDGTNRLVEGWTSPVFGSDGAVNRLVTLFNDVTERRRVERLRAGEARVLEMVACDRPLPDTLDTLAREFEALADGMKASVLLIEDGVRMRHAAAPHLPAQWAQLIDGEEIGPDQGSCGTAAYLKQAVIVTDIATDSRWARYREAALSYGFSACWSVPIMGPDQEVLGTFAFYYSRPRHPTDKLLELARHASQLAAVAIQRHRQQQALLEGETRARLIVENALDANVQINADGEVIAWSPSASAMFGYSPDQAIGTRVSELIVPHRYRELHERGMKRYMETGEHSMLNQRMELTALHGDGHEFPVELAVTAVRYGGRTLFSAFIKDLTDARRAEEELQHLRETEKLQSIFDLTPSSVGIARDGRLKYANARFRELFGLDIGDDVRGMYVDPAIRERILKELDAGRPVVSEEMQAYDGNGEVIDLLSTYHCLEFEAEPCVLAYQVDVTRLKQAERERKQLSDRLQMATRGANIGIWAWDTQTNHLQWDDVMHDLFKVAPGDFSDNHEAWKARIHPEDLPRVENALGEALRNNAGIDMEYRSIWPDGALRHFKTNAVVESDAEGARRYVGTNRDVTEAREAVDAMRDAKETAERATRAKSLFLANMSHEIRTPMNAVLGYAQLLMRDVSLTDAQKRKIDIIHTSGNHLLSLIDDVLEMSKIEAGRTTLAREPFDLRGLLEEIKLMFVELADAKGIDLIVDTDSTVPAIIAADPRKVRQVVINLIGNAVKYTERGFVRVHAAASSPAVDAPRVTVSIEDSGIGISAEVQSMIFNPFDRPETVSSGGTGLGLSISRNFARLMHGDVVVQSRLGQGSVFTFTFDADLAPDGLQSSSIANRRPLRIAAGQHFPSILIVDDVATNRAVLKDLLTGIGFETYTASDGERALEVHAQWRPELILMDLRMAGMDGLETTRRLRQSNSCARIIAITASAVAQTEQEARDAGVDDFLRKPYRENDLLERIGRMLAIRYEYTDTDAGMRAGVQDVLHGGEERGV